MKKIEWKTLGEICGIFKGEQLNKKDMLKIATYPVINGGTSPSGYIENYNQKENTITISQGGSAGYVNFIETKFWLGAHAFAVVPNDKVSKKYIYHFLKENQYKLENKKVGATIPNISKNDVQNFLISLPPLKKQAEIAETLDKFTELTEELTAREAQYEYYRDMLLSKEYIDKKRSQFVKIKEICIKQKGINITAKEMKQLNKKNTPIKIFGGGNTSVTVDKKDINVDIISKPSIIVKSRGNIDFEFYDKPFTHKNELWSYSSKNNNVLNIKYLYYYLKNEIEYFKNKAIHGRMPQISNGITDDYSFYLPPIEIQNKIVNILDNFETLVNDIKQGLPREIELRQKQYEYYREKLLTFEEK